MKLVDYRIFETKKSKNFIKYTSINFSKLKKIKNFKIQGIKNNIKLVYSNKLQKYAFMNKYRFLTNFIYDSAKPFNLGFSVIEMNSKKFVINEKFEIIESNVKKYFITNKGFFFRKNGKYHLIDNKGNYILKDFKKLYDSIDNDSKWILFEDEFGFGWIDSQKNILKKDLKQANIFLNGLAVFRNKNETYIQSGFDFILEDGREIIKNKSFYARFKDRNIIVTKRDEMFYLYDFEGNEKYHSFDVKLYNNFILIGVDYVEKSMDVIYLLYNYNYELLISDPISHLHKPNIKSNIFQFKNTKDNFIYEMTSDLKIKKRKEKNEFKK